MIQFPPLWRQKSLPKLRTKFETRRGQQADIARTMQQSRTTTVPGQEAKTQERPFSLPSCSHIHTYIVSKKKDSTAFSRSRCFRIILHSSIFSSAMARDMHMKSARLHKRIDAVAFPYIMYGVARTLTCMLYACTTRGRHLRMDCVSSMKLEAGRGQRCSGTESLIL